MVDVTNISSTFLNVYQTAVKSMGNLPPIHLFIYGRDHQSGRKMASHFILKGCWENTRKVNEFTSFSPGNPPKSWTIGESLSLLIFCLISIYCLSSSIYHFRFVITYNVLFSDIGNYCYGKLKSVAPILAVC